MPRSAAMATAAAALLAAAGCGSQGHDELALPTSPTTTVPIGTDVTLAPGESAAIAQASLTMTFVGVTGDSRCPANALIQCVWEGSAVIALRITGAGANRTLSLETIESKSAVDVDTVTIRLISVTPVPETTRPISPASYRATLRVTRR